MRRMWLVIASLGGAALLTGCPPTYPNCKSDENCKDRNEVCVQGQCQECATDAHCKAGFSCQGNKCVPKGGCRSDAECGAGQRCDNGICQAQSCESPADCPAGQDCRGNRCVARTSCQSDAECGAEEGCQEGFCVSKDQLTRAACQLGPIRFDFNRANLTTEAERQLADLADCLKKRNLKLTLEGHADERGTEEFNLQLSNRRAESVKRYLATLGVKAQNLETVGYGEARPADSGSGEAAWSANRRVELKQ